MVLMDDITLWSTKNVLASYQIALFLIASPLSLKTFKTFSQNLSEMWIIIIVACS